MKINSEIVELSARFIKANLKKKLSEDYCYHNVSHTAAMVNAIEEISTAMDIEEHQKHILLTAGWFHDIGYICQVEDHEKLGAEIAQTFLTQKGVDKEDIDTVKSCILATQYPQKPLNILEKIMGDADMIHLGKKDFFDKTDLVRREWSKTRNLNLTDAGWYRSNLDFLSDHQFHTNYCTKRYNSQKQKNIKQVRRLLENEMHVSHETGTDKPGGNAKPQRKEKAERGIETLFKTASRNHMELSSMADSKAHILLSINSIIISVVITVLSKRLEQSTYMLLPTALLLSVCLATIVFAVLTTQPKISKGTFTKEQVAKREANLLFFGNFHNMNWNTYEWGVKEIMNDKDYLYSSLTRDVYYLGKVLAVKYRYLNIGYKIFMFGLIASVIAFVASFCSVQ